MDDGTVLVDDHAVLFPHEPINISAHLNNVLLNQVLVDDQLLWLVIIADNLLHVELKTDKDFEDLVQKLHVHSIFQERCLAEGLLVLDNPQHVLLYLW